MSLSRVLTLVTLLGSQCASLAWQMPTTTVKTTTSVEKNAAAAAAAVVHHTPEMSRRSMFVTSTTTTAAVFALLAVDPHPAAAAKCTNLETCREIGDQKDADKLAANPIVRLGDGLQYKVLTAGVGDEQITNDTNVVKIAYSLSQASGRYMYSQGYGYNKINAGNGMQMADLGMDGLTVHLNDPNAKEVPLGVRRALLGMKRGEKRRIEVPPALGFATSDWNPKPTTFRGERQIVKYKNVLYGQGDQQPPFPAPIIWDVEVLSFR